MTWIQPAWTVSNNGAIEVQVRLFVQIAPPDFIPLDFVTFQSEEALSPIRSLMVGQVNRKRSKDQVGPELETLCSTCHGTGRIPSSSANSRARRGGSASYLRSLGPGALSMSARGRRGGRPKEKTLAELVETERGEARSEPKGEWHLRARIASPCSVSINRILPSVRHPEYKHDSF